MLRRFIIAMKHKPDDAFQRLKDHVAWRKRFGADLIIHEDFLMHEARRELYWGGKDKEGRPALIFRFANHHANEDANEYVRFLVFVLEKGRKVLRFDKMNVVFDVGGASRAQFNMDHVRLLVSTLQQNYPERVAAMFIFPVSMIERMLFNVVKTFMDPVTARKVALLSPSEFKTRLLDTFAIDQLEGRDGGMARDFKPLVIPVEEAVRNRMKIRSQVKNFYQDFKTKNGRDPSDTEVKSVLKSLFHRAKKLETSGSKKQKSAKK
eukprot:c8032_g1_i2.p1 GENE.c8032_g1_i2~~c8032_g1_i2.p1  ORF type:complete len:264 (-),score=47.15 c8032_g1_i2:168-959(-)